MTENSSEITLKEVLQKARGFWRYLLSRWVIIVVAGVIGAVAGFLYANFSKPLYMAQTSFVLSAGSKGAGGLASLAGQFGLDIGGGDDDAFTGDNILELFKSELIIKRALFRPLPDSGGVLINRVIDKAGFQKSWSGNDYLKRWIPFPDSASMVSPVQDSLVSAIRDFLLKKWLEVGRPDKKLSFYKVSTHSPDPIVSDYLTRYIVDEASQLYIETKTRSARTNLEMLQYEADSLRDRLNSRIYSMAETTDQTFNLNPALQTHRVSIQQNQVAGQALGAAYSEVMKDLEIAKITLQKDKPLFQIIDEPHLPLVKDKASRLIGLVLGGLIAGFLVVLVLVIRKAFKRIMS
ncbi:MAG TPA: hypothetical protein VL547_02935 [Dinghuibacter sp.]|jgi:uncharacterized protein involved in exopolysaccharide biosynthesis|uniref:hypothetical protein n=1 Tax=Dinghuibacter sp. TaxID=2024697 RepID=UPI002CA3712B|nr:hypothetical protein [Dinghuibacter sp.]HTJ10950.1 hypothetical protein [Dinghuibacter sp.]